MTLSVLISNLTMCVLMQTRLDLTGSSNLDRVNNLYNKAISQFNKAHLTTPHVPTQTIVKILLRNVLCAPVIPSLTTNKY